MNGLDEGTETDVKHLIQRPDTLGCRVKTIFCSCNRRRSLLVV